MLIENDNSGIAINELNDIECSFDGREVVLRDSDDFTATDFGSLTLIGKGDSVYFNIEKFRVNLTDNLSSINKSPIG